MYLGTDHQYASVLTRPDQRVGQLQGVDEAGTLLANVEARYVFEAELALEKWR